MRHCENLGSYDKPTLIIFNKIDAFTYTVRDAYDLTPVLRENLFT